MLYLSSSWGFVLSIHVEEQKVGDEVWPVLECEAAF